MFRAFTAAALAVAFSTAPAWCAAAGESPAQALTFKECGAKYQAAKSDGSLDGKNWTDFRHDVCGIGTGKQEISGQSKPAAEMPSAAMIAKVSFPGSLVAADPGETPAKNRMRTCLKAYHQNKDAGTLYGLRWVQKGGGFYSLCNKHLKGES